MHGGVAIILSTLALAATATAQDSCFSGSSSLGDRRALATLRTAIDTHCPCASSIGALGRRHYMNCVRAQITAALQATTLRPECADNARALYIGATCGTNRVTCAKPATADAGASCRLAAPTGHNACGGSDAAELACNAQTQCADVIDATAGTCIDPRQPGPYGVGVRTVHLVKDSVTAPGTDRVLDTIVWYPTAPDSGMVDPMLKGVVGAPLDNSGGPYPLLMFSHGSCGYPNQSTFLTPLIASYGFVVAAPPHPGNTLSDFPTCMSAQSLATSALERPADIAYAADQLLAANADQSSPFFGSIDPQRMGMSGHSFGGFTTYVVVDHDPRYKVAVALAPAVPGNAKLNLPSLSMLSELDTYVNDDAIRAVYATAATPKVEVEVLNAGHFAYSDGCFPSPDCNPPTTLIQDEAHALVQRWVVPFVLRYLKGATRFDPLLDAVPPGVVVEQDRGGS